jgi:hypothetical protein
MCQEISPPLQREKIDDAVERIDQMVDLPPIPATRAPLGGGAFQALAFRTPLCLQRRLTLMHICS